MRRFDRHLKYEEAKEACAARGIAFDDRKYREEGFDFVHLKGTFAGVEARVFFWPFNGKFYGRTESGVHFHSSDELDDQPWFNAILELLYRDKVTLH